MKEARKPPIKKPKTRGPNKHLNEMPIEEFLDRLGTLADDRLFSEQHAAAMLCKSVKTLQEERRLYHRQRELDPAAAEIMKTKFIPWIHAGPNCIRYRLGDLREWIARMRFGGDIETFDSDSLDISKGIGIMLS
jgi:hypothetical protein